MKYQIKYSKEFKKGLKKLKNDTQSLNLIKSVIVKLASKNFALQKFHNHFGFEVQLTESQIL